ncbi:hypothetical protein N9E28_01470 [Alphaproteobacteria bacterium]|nr:hypothetical protein [Alphaproteobacteria bacterium]
MIKSAKHIINFAKFTVAGLANLFFGYTVFSSFLFILTDDIWLANFFALFATTLFGYHLSMFFVFKTNKKGTFLFYLALIAFQYIAFTPAIIFLAENWFTPKVSYLVVCVPAAILSFLIQKFLIFRPNT